MNSSSRGFTLIELMIVVVIIGIIAAIGYPSYLDYVRKSRRADGQSAMLDAQIKEERYRAYQNTYADAASLTAANLGILDNDYYVFDVVSVSSSTYTITASATGDQVNDDGCENMTLNQANALTPEGCWKR